MDFIQTIIIAIVEGLTEFLPVSSTGHMIIAENLLGVDIQDKFVNAFTVIIQLESVCVFLFNHSNQLRIEDHQETWKRDADTKQGQ